MKVLVDFKSVVRTSQHIYKILINVKDKAIYLNPSFKSKAEVYDFLAEIGIPPSAIGYISLVEKKAEPSFTYRRKRK